MLKLHEMQSPRQVLMAWNYTQQTDTQFRNFLKREAINELTAGAVALTRDRRFTLDVTKTVIDAVGSYRVGIRMSP